jgi:hypothetical protein
VVSGKRAKWSQKGEEWPLVNGTKPGHILNRGTKPWGQSLATFIRGVASGDRDKTWPHKRGVATGKRTKWSHKGGGWPLVIGKSGYIREEGGLWLMGQSGYIREEGGL